MYVYLYVCVFVIVYVHVHMPVRTCETATTSLPIVIHKNVDKKWVIHSFDAMQRHN